MLAGPALTLALRNRGIQVGGISAPKQTETTQRWKASLTVEGHAVALPTKLEFSPRASSDEAILEAVSASVLAEHQSMTFLAPHYPLEAAVRQKVKALADRREVQAREVFDLGAVLIPRTGGKTELLQAVQADVRAAMDRAMTLSHADYVSQVVSYLHPDHGEATSSTCHPRGRASSRAFPSSPSQGASARPPHASGLRGSRLPACGPSWSVNWAAWSA